MKKIIILLLGTFLTACQSDNVIVQANKTVEKIINKESIIDLGNKGPSVKINLNFNINKAFNIKNIDDAFNGINSISRLELRLSTEQGTSLADRFGDDCPCPPKTRKGIKYINITNPSINNSITVKGLKPNTNYYLSARAYTNLKVNGVLKEVNIISSDGTDTDILGNGTAGAYGSFGISEEYISVDTNGVLKINNDNNPLSIGSPNNNWDIQLQLMKSKGAEIRANDGLIQDGDNTTNISITPTYSLSRNSIVRADADDSNIKSNFDTAVFPDGKLLVVWDSSDGINSDIYARIFNKDGTFAGNKMKVNTSSSEVNIKPKVSIRNNLLFFVTWENSSQNAVYIRKCGTSGISDPEIKASSVSDDIQSNPDIGVGSVSGTTIVTWESNKLSNSDIKARVFDDLLTPKTNEFIVNDYTIGQQISPSIAVDSSNNFVISWGGEGKDSINGIYFRKYNNAWATSMLGERVNEEISSLKPFSSISMNDSGNFAISYTSFDNNGVYIQKYFSNSKKKDNEISFNNDYPINSTSLSINNEGKIYLAWQQNERIEIRDFNFSDSIINSNTFNYLGIDGNSYYLYNPNIFLNKNKNAMLSWIENPNMADSKVYFKQLIMP